MTTESCIAPLVQDNTSRIRDERGGGCSACGPERTRGCTQVPPEPLDLLVPSQKRSTPGPARLKQPALQDAKVIRSPCFDQFSQRLRLEICLGVKTPCLPRTWNISINP